MRAALILSILAIVTLMGCDPGQGHIEAKYKAVMAVHDEMMPYLGPMSKARRALTAWADSLQQDKKQAAIALELRQAADTLAYADRIMQVWMQEFDADYDKKPAEEALRYLDAQVAAAATLKQNMLKAIAYANTVAEKHHVPAKVAAAATTDHSGHQH